MVTDSVAALVYLASVARQLSLRFSCKCMFFWAEIKPDVLCVRISRRCLLAPGGLYHRTLRQEFLQTSCLSLLEVLSYSWSHLLYFAKVNCQNRLSVDALPAGSPVQASVNSRLWVFIFAVFYKHSQAGLATPKPQPWLDGALILQNISSSFFFDLSSSFFFFFPLLWVSFSCQVIICSSGSGARSEARHESCEGFLEMFVFLYSFLFQKPLHSFSHLSSVRRVFPCLAALARRSSRFSSWIRKTHHACACPHLCRRLGGVDSTASQNMCGRCVWHALDESGQLLVVDTEVCVNEL